MQAGGAGASGLASLLPGVVGRLQLRPEHWRLLEAHINATLEQASETQSYREKISILLQCHSLVEQPRLPVCPLHGIVNREVGLAHFDAGESVQALGFHRRELEVARLTEDPVAECEALGNVGMCLRATGAPAESFPLPLPHP